jgi:hypothetical protein
VARPHRVVKIDNVSGGELEETLLKRLVDLAALLQHALLDDVRLGHGQTKSIDPIEHVVVRFGAKHDASFCEVNFEAVILKGLAGSIRGGARVEL